MDFRVLGPVEVWSGDQRVELGPAESGKVKCLLAALLWAPGSIVSSETLVSRVWGETVPGPDVRYKYVSWVRAALAPHGIPVVSARGSYRLGVTADQVDLHRFRAGVAAGRAELRAGRPEKAAVLLGEALAQWRGQALADVPGDWAARVRDSLDRERQDAFADRVRADLAADPGRDLASELTGWWSEHPENETFAELLMTAHAGAGRPAQARRVFEDTRRWLRETMDVEPGPALRDRNDSLFPVGRPAPPDGPRDEPSPPAVGWTEGAGPVTHPGPAPDLAGPDLAGPEGQVIPGGSSPPGGVRRRRARAGVGAGVALAVVVVVAVLAVVATRGSAHDDQVASPGGGPAVAALDKVRVTAVTGADGGPVRGTTVRFTLAVSSATVGSQLWVYSRLVLEAPVHSVYFAKEPLTGPAGTRTVTLTFFGARPGSTRFVGVVEADRGGAAWLAENLNHDGDPTWDMNRVMLPSGVHEVAREVPVTIPAR